MTDEQKVKPQAVARKRVAKPAADQAQVAEGSPETNTASVAAAAMAEIEADLERDKLKDELRQELMVELRASGMLALPSGGGNRPDAFIQRDPKTAAPAATSEMLLPSMPDLVIKREDY